MYELASETWDQKELKALERVIKSNRFSMGEEVFSFEKEFANFFETKYAVMVNSGSSANLLMIASLFFHSKYKLKKGDEVIVPAVSWSTTYTPLQQYGLKLKFIDIDVHTLNLDIDSLESAITENTKAIFAVNLLGNPLNYDRILKIANNHNLILIEDNCESMGAKFNGKFTGTFGVMGSFSTFFSHHISTMEGGVIVTNDDELYEILVSLRAHGWTRNLPEKSKIYKKNKDGFYEMFNFILPGYNVRPIEFGGALGKEQLKKLPDFIENRRKNGGVFKQLFSKLKSIHIQEEVGESSYFGFAIIIKKDANYDRAMLLELLKKNNIEYRPIVAGNFLRNSVINHFDYEVFKEVSNADYIHDNGLFIGNHHYDCFNELTYIYELILELEEQT